MIMGQAEMKTLWKFVTKLGLVCCKHREGMTLEVWTAVITTSMVLGMQER